MEVGDEVWMRVTRCGRGRGDVEEGDEVWKSFEAWKRGRPLALRARKQSGSMGQKMEEWSSADLRLKKQRGSMGQVAEERPSADRLEHHQAEQKHVHGSIRHLHASEAHGVSPCERQTSQGSWVQHIRGR